MFLFVILPPDGVPLFSFFAGFLVVLVMLGFCVLKKNY